MAASKTLWITSIQPETISGKPFVPTVLRYQPGGDTVFGHDAIGPDASVGFKLALGEIPPGQSLDARRKFPCADGRRRSAFELSQDFLNRVLSSVEFKLPKPNSSGSIAARVVVAEPLNFQVKDRSPEWLSNYRRNIARMLSRFQTIEFLPEPFAVYQYYKYGLRLPKLAERTKRFALILDMGGGTFDVCMIESTAEGDISRSGSHSKPLSANSVPFAGFHLDRQIALYLLKRNATDAKRQDVERYYEQYERTLRGKLDRRNLKQEAQAFMANMDALRPVCEQKKIELANAITDWQLDTENYDQVEVDVPTDPLAESTRVVPCELYGHQMFAVFEEIWNTKLKGVVKNVIRGAHDRLNGNKIDVSLISGGSANIGWLTALLMRDFSEELQGAEPVNIEGSYQDVVANGLAIECARRHFLSSSGETPEFVAVTYNPVRLLLAPNDCDLAELRFGSSDDRVNMEGAGPGDLIPSAQVFRRFFDAPLQWQVRLPRPPRQHLDYIFCRSSDPDREDEDVLDLAYNLEERRLYTREAKFDGQTTVEVTVRDDGTVIPRFIYKKENRRGGVPENSEKGRPFYIDMTTNATNMPMANYIGLDFGTSNSSICLLSDDSIDMVHRRNSSNRWRSLSETLADIPFPAAAALRRYLAEHETARIFDVAIGAYEACLTLLAYSMAADGLYEDPSWKALATFRHRSLGPLKALLTTSVGRGPGTFCVKRPEHLADVQFLEEACRDFTEGKHHQTSQVSPKWVDYVEDIARATAGAFSGNYFGYCATSIKVAYEHRFEGIFKVAHDQPPFVHHYRYSSKEAIDPTVALMFDPRRRKARSLTPLLVWEQEGFSDQPVCYVLDVKSKCQYKPCHIADKKASDDINPGLSKALDDLLENGRFVTGEVDFEVSELNAVGEDNDEDSV